ncbi:unnamed protein product, partial [Protopolystoma xenopodis]
VDECSGLRGVDHTCPQETLCINTPGAYECVCKSDPKEATEYTRLKRSTESSRVGEFLQRIYHNLFDSTHTRRRNGLAGEAEAEAETAGKNGLEDQPPDRICSKDTEIGNLPSFYVSFLSACTSALRLTDCLLSQPTSSHEGHHATMKRIKAYEFATKVMPGSFARDQFASILPICQNGHLFCPDSGISQLRIDGQFASWKQRPLSWLAELQTSAERVSQPMAFAVFSSSKGLDSKFTRKLGTVEQDIGVCSNCSQLLAFLETEAKDILPSKLDESTGWAKHQASACCSSRGKGGDIDCPPHEIRGNTITMARTGGDFESKLGLDSRMICGGVEAEISYQWRVLDEVEDETNRANFIQNTQLRTVSIGGESEHMISSLAGQDDQVKSPSRQESIKQSDSSAPDVEPEPVEEYSAWKRLRRRSVKTLGCEICLCQVSFCDGHDFSKTCL